MGGGWGSGEGCLGGLAGGVQVHTHGGVQAHTQGVCVQAQAWEGV